MSSLSDNALQKMLSLITVMFQKHKKFPYDKVCDHSLASSMNTRVSYIWVWTRLFILASEMFGLQMMPVATMHLFSLIKASAQNALSSAVDTHAGHGRCLSSACPPITENTKPYPLSFLKLYTCFIHLCHLAIIPTGTKTFTLKNRITLHTLPFGCISSSPSRFTLIVQ